MNGRVMGVVSVEGGVVVVFAPPPVVPVVPAGWVPVVSGGASVVPGLEVVGWEVLVVPGGGWVEVLGAVVGVGDVVSGVDGVVVDEVVEGMVDGGVVVGGAVIGGAVVDGVVVVVVIGVLVVGVVVEVVDGVVVVVVGGMVVEGGGSSPSTTLNLALAVVPSWATALIRCHPWVASEGTATVRAKRPPRKLVWTPLKRTSSSK